MEPMVRTKNVVKGEAILRFIIGVILIVLAFFIGGIFGWILGLIGVVLILTAIFRY